MIEALLSLALVILPPAEQTKSHGVSITRVESEWRDSGVQEVWNKTDDWVRDFGLCVRRHESLNAGHYKANNPTSTASGAYQFLQSTWDGNARWATVAGQRVAVRYVGKPASSAPDWIQDAVFVHSVNNGGVLNWRGTNCGYGT